MDENYLNIVDKVSDIILMSLILLQEVSGKSREEILEAIKDEGIKTDDLIKRLR